MKGGGKIVGVLTVVCIMCAFFLSFVASIAQEKIETNQKKAVQDALVVIQPQCARIDEFTASGNLVYTLYDDVENFLGYGFLAQGQGYGGTIKMMVVVDASWQVLSGIEIIESQETPGLGARIVEGVFKHQFRGIPLNAPLEYTKGEPVKANEIKAITGATISSKAVVAIINKKIEELKTVCEERGEN